MREQDVECDGVNHGRTPPVKPVQGTPQDRIGDLARRQNLAEQASLVVKIDDPFFNRSLMLCQLPDKVFLLGATTVILPVFSEIVRDGRTLKTPYLHAVSLITGFQWPALVVVALLAAPIVELLFGHQWISIVPYVQIMAIATMFSFSFQLNYPVFLSVGAVRDSFRRGLIVWPVSALVLTVAAFSMGLAAIAIAFGERH